MIYFLSAYKLGEFCGSHQLGRSYYEPLFVTLIEIPALLG